MKERNRVYAFLVKRSGVAAADKAMTNFVNQQKKYVEQIKK